MARLAEILRGIVFVVVIFGAVMLWIYIKERPKTMSVDEFKKKANYMKVGKKVILKGTVIDPASLIVETMKSSGGQEYKSIVMEEDGVRKTVWYDPGTMGSVPKVGDKISVTGKIFTSLYGGKFSPQNELLAEKFE